MSTEAAHTDEAHATTGHYVRIAIILTVLTIMEVATYYVDIPFALADPLLLVSGRHEVRPRCRVLHAPALRQQALLRLLLLWLTIEILLLIALMVLFGIRSG